MSEVLALLFMILVQIESGGDKYAVGTANDIGIVQITPIYLKDVNIILKEERYTLQDRYDVKKSREMVNIYMKHYGADTIRSKKLSMLDKMLRLGSYHRGGPRGFKKQSKELKRYRRKIKREYYKLFPEEKD